MMARYRKIDPKIWNDEKFRAISDDAKLLVLFALTHPHMTSLGAMRASIEGLAAEIGWKHERVRKGLAEPFRKGFLRYDETACFLWFPNFLRYNTPENPNVVKSWAGIIDLLPECAMKVQLLQVVRKEAERVCGTLPEGLGEWYRKGMPNPEPEPEQEQEQEKDSSEPLRADSEQTLRPVLNFPTNGKAQSWGLTQELIDSLQAAYPGVDVLAEARKARAWCLANVAKRKTPRGMGAFLTRWIDRAQNQAGRNGQPAASADDALYKWDN